MGRARKHAGKTARERNAQAAAAWRSNNPDYYRERWAKDEEYREKRREAWRRWKKRQPRKL